MTYLKRLTRFSGLLLISAGMVVLLAVSFVFYVRSEARVNRANELRHRSFLLARELRQSGDDLTRMVRTYVATGDPIYKQHFQDILDIRDGKKPRPENYSRPYWDLLLSGQTEPRRKTTPAIPLLELMRQAGFTEEEFRKLAEAKANSDALTAPEFEAMKLIESTGPEARASRARAAGMLYDDKYHLAKFTVMKPIHDFFVLVDQRTLAAVQAAVTQATTLRSVFVAIGLGLMFMLWRTHASLRDTLGGSLDEVQAQIVRIGSGDFDSTLELKGGLENSVLGWLLATRGELNNSARERKQAAAQLQGSESQYRRLFEAAKDGILILNAETGMIEDVNPFLTGLLGFTRDEVLQRRLWELGCFQNLVANQEKFAELQRNEYVRYADLPLKAADGRQIAVEFVSNVYEVNGAKVIQCNIRDITERKRAEEKLRDSLEEKEVLLKEVHHRVKNNLQIISSLLNLQWSGTRNPELTELLQVNQSRIRSMALVHEHLYLSKNLAELDFGVFIRELAGNVFRSFSSPGAAVTLEFDLQPVSVGVDTAIPCALIINELISNSLKHAFPDQRAGKIHVSLHTDPTGQSSLTVRDNGVGLAAELDFSDTDSLGLQLVNTLSRQIHGTLELDRAGGTRVTISFPPHDPKRKVSP